MFKTISQLSSFVRPNMGRKLFPSTKMGRRLLGTIREVVKPAGSWENKAGYVFLGTSTYGQSKPGVEKGPHSLIKQFSFPPEVRTVEPLVGREWPPLGSEQLEVSTNQRVRIRNPTAVGESNFALHHSIVEESARFVRENRRLPSILMLGGDHSLGIGSVSATAVLCARAIAEGWPHLPFSNPELVLIWVDAHADINTPSVTLSGNLHGCPVSLLVGLDTKGWRELRHFDWAYQCLPPGKASLVRTECLAFIGTRDLDEAEKEIVAERKIKNYSMEVVKKAGRDMKKIVADCIKSADPMGQRPIHLSFDVDALDPRHTPSTGTSVADGLYLEEGKLIIEEVRATGRLVSMDLVEVNPCLGSADQVSRTVASAKELMSAYYSVSRKHGE